VTGATAFQSAAVGGQPTQFQRQQFLSLYPRRDAFIWKTYDQERWQKANGPLLDAQILGVVSDEGRGLFRGCYWSHKTRHAVLDIDTESRYHNAAELQKLQAHLSAVGLYAITYRSSDSGGWHLYLPFDEWAGSDEVNQTLKVWLKTLGYEVKSGQLEIFPSGNALRLPLQKGFAWLAPDGSIKVRREEMKEDEAIASFLQDFEKNSRNWQQAKSLIESQNQSAGSVAGAQEHEKVISIAGFDDLFRKGKIQDVWEIGREYWRSGLTAKNQRHDAVMAVGHYLWYGDSSENIPAYPGRRNDENRARLIEAWLKKKHNGFCRHINIEQWKEIEAHIWRTVFWRRGKNLEARKPYPLTDRLLKRLLEVYTKTGRLYEIDRMAEANRKREQGARARIKNAVSQCLRTGQQITRNGLAEIAGCSPNTVSRHQDLWLLTTGSGVYNRGVGGVSSGSAVPGIGFEEKEKSEIPFRSGSDSADLETEQPLSVKVAPLQFCPANSQPESTQRKDRALRTAAQVFTPGPLLPGIRAEGQMCAGGISFTFQSSSSGPVCYTNATANGIRGRAGAASEVSVLVAFGTENKNEKIIPDATNYRFLTTVKRGYSSGLADELSLIQNRERSGNLIKIASGRPIESGLSGADAASSIVTDRGSGQFSDDSQGSQKPNSATVSKHTDPINVSRARLSVKRPTLRLRGPPD